MSRSQFVNVNGLRMFVREEGSGPLVVLCHGWPELSYSWRHQIPALAAAGFHVVAPDMRGFGQTDAPENVDAYSTFHLVGDVVALVQEFGAERAVVVGHDWGAHVAWCCALFRPDIFAAVAALSVPAVRRGSAPPLAMLKRAGIDRFYWHYFQERAAEVEFERDVERTIRTILYGRGLTFNLKADEGFLADGRIPEQLPTWLAEEDIAQFVTNFRRTGFRGGLNWYRNIDRNWELMAPWHEAHISRPALFVAGSRDPTINGPIGSKHLASMGEFVTDLRGSHILEGAGHWIQQERPAEVNELLVPFLRDVAQ